MVLKIRTKIAIILFLSATVFPFQNCVELDGTKLAQLPGEGQGFQGALLPYGEYWRRYSGANDCDDVIAILESNPNGINLAVDNCAQVDRQIHIGMIDYQNYNREVIGVGPAILRKVEMGQAPLSVPYDRLFCRSVEDSKAIDVMVYGRFGEDIHHIKVIEASRPNRGSPWERVVVENFEVSGGFYESIPLPLDFGDNFTLDVDQTPIDSDSPGLFSGQLKGSNSSVELTCRVESLEPIMSRTIAPPPNLDRPDPKTPSDGKKEFGF